jgi:hypothetical protein
MITDDLAHVIISLSTLIAIAALIITIIATWYSARAFFLKIGTRIRGSYSIVSSIACSDDYVGEVTLYNMKDRAVVIFGIFLELSHGVYVELENFDGSPLILRPFEAWRRDYEPIEKYTMSFSKVELGSLFKSKNLRSRLVLSTAEGRYTVRNWIKSWHPNMMFFRNYATSVVRPVRSVFEGAAYGSNARYVVEFIRSNGKRQFVPIYPSDTSIRKFRGFRLTEKSLQSKRHLEEFLLERAVSGVLPCLDLVVHDLESLRAQMNDGLQRPTIIAERQSWFEYHVLGRIATLRENQRLRSLNRARHKDMLLRAKEDVG